MASKRRRPDATELLFRDTMRRVLSIPPDEARAIVERTAPAAPRQVAGLREAPARPPTHPRRAR